MRRAKLQLAYDRSKLDEEKVWSILNELGHKRSDTIQLLVEYVIRRFGDDVLRKDRLDSLEDTLNREVEEYYLCRVLALGNEKQEVPAELRGRMQTISDVIGQNSSAAKEQTKVAHSESQEDPNPVSPAVMPTEGAVSTILPGQQLSMAGTGGWDSDAPCVHGRHIIPAARRDRAPGAHSFGGGHSAGCSLRERARFPHGDRRRSMTIDPDYGIIN